MDHPLAPAVEFGLFSTDGRSTGDWRRTPATRIDLHCHSTFSDETIKYLPGIVYHPLLTPEEVYDQAKARGMDFVTITDHDTISGCLDLLNKRGDLADFIVGEEVTVAFPEDGTIVHVNVFDINEEQHRELQALRGSIYELAAYARSIDKLYVLNHLTWTEQHRVLKTWQIEKLLEHFDVFEGINGARSYAHNAFAWAATRGRGKTLVGGSDSHTHRVGTTYTLTDGATREDVLANIKSGIAEPAGAFGTAEKLREDVWLVAQKNFERRLEDANTVWQRAICRGMRRFSRVVYPLACLGYDTRQNTLVRAFLRAMPG
ncbi:MAG: hypothetical protein KDA32_04355 [Phycisphaerales bacterium]|nr:hypothetical protein [Phycisphaerales bacterium]